MDSVNSVEDEYGTDVSDYTSVDHISNSGSASFLGTDVDDDPFFRDLPVPTFDGELDMDKFAEWLLSNEWKGESILPTDKKNVDGSDQRSIVAATSEGTRATSLEGELENNKEISITYEVLQQQFGKKLKDAAKYFEVSQSTLKRWCREHGISRWPSSKRKTGSRSPPNTHAKRFVRTRQKHLVEPINKVSSCPDIPPSEGTTAHVDTAAQSASSVTIKAKYLKDTIKFSFTLTSGLENLVENVTKRLKLDAGTFKLKYSDNEDELILIACDDDLRECIDFSRSSGQGTVRILVENV